MTPVKDFEKRIFSLSDNADFEVLALDLFRYQYENNKIYRSYTEALSIDPRRVERTADIPFLPISFFKTHRVTSGEWEPELFFESSGTTQTVNSRHYIRDAGFYEQSFTRTFGLFYGPARQYVVIGLLPAYLERQHSSLVHMVNSLIRQSGHPESGFFLYEYESLSWQLQALESREQPTLLIGVTFALLDFAARHPLPLQHTIVMETGGMKGRQREQTREEVHAFLRDRLRVAQIHSEYGMTELLSQAYAKKEGRFQTPPWMKVLLRDENDPLSVSAAPAAGKGARSGAINIIDLANIHSCAFLATEDLGRLHGDGSFEVLGRMDNSALRGCSLMAV